MSLLFILSHLSSARLRKSQVMVIPTHAPRADVLDQERAWQLFTKGISKDEAFQHASLDGNEMLARKVFDTVSIIT